MCDIGVNMLLLFIDNSCKLCSCFYCSFRCYEVWWDGVWWRIWARGSHLQQSRTHWALSGNGQLTFFWGSTIFILKKNLLTSFLLITVSQFNIFKDMYCHNICNLLMIINYKINYKYSNKKHEKGCQNNLEENYIELCWISISSVTMTQITVFTLWSKGWYMLCLCYSHEAGSFSPKKFPRGGGQPPFQNSGWSLNPNGQVICLLYMSDRIRTMFWRVPISKL